mgnify:CR=1 FL=1
MCLISERRDPQDQSEQRDEDQNHRPRTDQNHPSTVPLSRLLCCSPVKYTHNENQDASEYLKRPCRDFEHIFLLVVGVGCGLDHSALLANVDDQHLHFIIPLRPIADGFFMFDVPRLHERVGVDRDRPPVLTELIEPIVIVVVGVDWFDPDQIVLLFEEQLDCVCVTEPGPHNCRVGGD